MDIKEYEMTGLKSYDIRVIPDERGFFSEVLRKDWTDLLGDEETVQANMSLSYPGMIRAWHRHLRGQVDCFLVVKGALKICAYDDRDGEPTNGKLVEIIASAQKPTLVRVPGIYWHGIKNISDEASMHIYFVNRLYEYADPDEERRPWNDARIIDPRTGEPFDWNKPPHK